MSLRDGGLLRSSRRRFFFVLAGIVAFGLLVRIVFVRAYAPTQLPIADGLWFHSAGIFLANGKGLIDPLAYAFGGHIRQSASHPPLWIFVLGLVSFLGGTSVYVHQMTEVVVAAIAVGVVGLLGREVAGDGTGLLAGALAAVYPMFWASQGDLYSESLYTVIIAALLLTAYRLLKTPTWRVAAGFGVTAGLAALCRGEALLFLPLLVVPVVLRAQLPRRGRLLLVLAAGAGAVLVLAPWTIYNLTRFERPVLITTSVGGVIGGANCPTTYHGAHIGGWNLFCAARAVASDESQQENAVGRLGLDYARDHLDRVPLVMAARVGRTLELYAVAPDTRGPEPVQWLMAGAWYAALAGAIAGVVVARRRHVTIWPLLTTVIVVIPAVALTWGTPRFRVPIDVAALVLTAIALNAARHRLARRWHRGAPTG